MVDATPILSGLFAEAVATLRAAGIDDPRREAIGIWSDLAGVTAATAGLRMAEVVDAASAARLSDAVRRRAHGEPLAYVTGWTGFRHLRLQCDRRALIPRPETEGLVEAALARVRTGVAADIGTGTGAIALALRDEGGFDEVLGVDLSASALAVARANGAATGRPVTWLEGDLLAPIAGRRVDLLVSNPPYLTADEYAGLDPSVRDYEPALALLGGDDGQQVVRRILDEGRSVVAVGGWIALEVDCRRAADTGRLASAMQWQGVTVLDDLFGRARYLLAQRGSDA